MRSFSDSEGRACPLFYCAHAHVEKLVQSKNLQIDSVFRSLRWMTDKEPSPSSRSRKEIPAEVARNVEWSSSTTTEIENELSGTSVDHFLGKGS